VRSNGGHTNFAAMVWSTEGIPGAAAGGGDSALRAGTGAAARVGMGGDVAREGAADEVAEEEETADLGEGAAAIA